MEVFDLNNFQIGVCFSFYGFCALLSYFFGGTLADRFKPQVLMSISLLLTSLGGFFLLSFPTFDTIKWIYAYWGFTTVFLFWSPMIKATRIWGGDKDQGLAFGILDGGRGLTAALIGTFSLFIFYSAGEVDFEVASLLEKKDAFWQVVLFSSLSVMAISVLVFFFLRLNIDSSDEEAFLDKFDLSKVKDVIKLTPVWLLMGIVLCAYMGYKTTDIVPLYASEIMGYNDMQSAKISNGLLYLRPVTGILVGLISYRFRSSLLLPMGFLLVLLCSLGFALFDFSQLQIIFYFSSIVFIGIGTYSARTLYFSVMREAKIPLILTGTAVGLISFIGFTPDIFSGLLLGFLLDNFPGLQGHQLVFWNLIIFSLVGLSLAILLRNFVVKSGRVKTHNSPM